jgi:hypothetical protein
MLFSIKITAGTSYLMNPKPYAAIERFSDVIGNQGKFNTLRNLVIWSCCTCEPGGQEPMFPLPVQERTDIISLTNEPPIHKQQLMLKGRSMLPWPSCV